MTHVKPNFYQIVSLLMNNIIKKIHKIIDVIIFKQYFLLQLLHF